MRVGVLFSGGKDSTYAALLASRDHELACLVTMFPRNEASYMFHFPNLRWTKSQAHSMRVPQLCVETAGVKEEELGDLKGALAAAKQQYHLKGIFTGALASVYQKTRVERICGELELDCRSPLWGTDPEAHLRRLLREGFHAIVTSVSALGLGREWLGKELDEDSVAKLVLLAGKYKFHAGFEGGEAETFVTDCPMFAERIGVADAVEHWHGDSGNLEITGIRVEKKASS